jgi:hypothetical protein
LNSSAQLRESASILVDNVESLTNCSHFVYDTIEVLGQYCGTVCDKSIQLAYNAFIDNEIKRGETIADQVFMLLYEVDDLMGVIPGRSVHAWSRNAETFGSDPQKKAYYRKNGLRLLSTWGGPILADYAARMWSGLIYSYYAARWQAYFSSVISKEDFDVEKWEHNWIENKCVHESKQFDVIKKIKKAFALVSKLDSWLGNENVISHSQKVGRWTCKGNTCARVDVSNMLTRTGRYLFKIEQDTGMAMPEVHRARLFANDSLVHDCERVKPNVYQINCLDRKPGLSYSVLVDFGNPDKRELYGDFWMSCLGSKDVIVRKKVSDLEFQK